MSKLHLEFSNMLVLPGIFINVATFASLPDYNSYLYVMLSDSADQTG